MQPKRSGHVPVDGLDLFFEVHGDPAASGRTPLLLIPGAFMGTDAMRAWVDAFSPGRPVIVYDQQGHGRTPDTARAMSYERFADDAAELLRALDVPRADVLGYSQGGGVAWQLAIRHPDLVGKLVSMSATTRKEGWYPAVLTAIEGMRAEHFAGSPVEAAFLAHTPDADAFAAWVEKMRVLNGEDQEIDDEVVRRLAAPTMVIIGDADGVTPEHALRTFELRGGGDEEAAVTGMLQRVPAARLVILPGMSHIGIAGAWPVLEPMVSAFLDDEQPVTPDLF